MVLHWSSTILWNKIFHKKLQYIRFVTSISFLWEFFVKLVDQFVGPNKRCRLLCSQSHFMKTDINKVVTPNKKLTLADSIKIRSHLPNIYKWSFHLFKIFNENLLFLHQSAISPQPFFQLRLSDPSKIFHKINPEVRKLLQVHSEFKKSLSRRPIRTRRKFFLSFEISTHSLTLLKKYLNQ